MAIVIPDTVWVELGGALRPYLAALVAYWRSPAFVPAHVFGFSSERKLVQTNAEPTSRRLKQLGYPIRGLPGTKVTVKEEKHSPRVWDAMNPHRWGNPNAPSVESVQLGEAHEGIRAVLDAHQLLRRAICLISWGPGASEKIDEAQDLAPKMFEPHFMEAGRIEMLLGGIVQSRVGNIEALQTFEYDQGIVDEVIDRLRTAAGAERFPFSVSALLNSPPVDSRAVLLFEGQWYSAPFTLTMGFPEDAFVAEVIETVGYGGVPWGHDHLHEVNTYLRLEYELPSTITSDEMLSAHASAGSYIREAVDIVRLLHPDDIGIIWLGGSRPVPKDDLTLTPPFLVSFPETPNQMYRVPMRRIYDPPSGALLTAMAISEFSSLFTKYSVNRIKIPGLPIAMERLRGIYDRYAPDEVGRMVDAVTGLEALYLPEKQAELKFRLQHRAAWFLENDSAARLAIVGELGEIYDARSALVHSGELTKKLKRRDRSLMQKAVEILRRSILRFLSTEFGVGKSAAQMSREWLALTLGKVKARAVPASSNGEMPLPDVNDGSTEDAEDRD